MDVVRVITYSRRERQDPSKATFPGVRSRTLPAGIPAPEPYSLLLLTQRIYLPIA